MINQAIRKTISAITVMSLLGASFMPAVSFAAASTDEQAVIESGQVYKDETVYVNADASGNVEKTTVSDVLKNAGEQDSISDQSTLKDIVNIKGDETFEQTEDALVWETAGEDITYQGTTDAELPVTMKVSYTLDGQNIAAEDLIGQSGKLAIRYTFDNKTKSNGVYVPFTIVTGMYLENDKFSDVKIDNGKVVTSGDKIFVVGTTMPGLESSLDLGDTLDMNLPESFTVTATVEDFEMGQTISMMSSDLINELDLDEIDSTDDIESDLNDLSSASQQLTDGAQELAEGTATLDDKSGTFAEGVNALNDGIQLLSDQGGLLADGVEQYTAGADQLASGTQQYVAKAGELAEGTQAYASGEKQFTAGVSALNDAMPSLTAGTQQLAGGLDQLNAAVSSDEAAAKMAALKTGSSDLSTGAQALDAGVSQLTDADSLQALIDAMTADQERIAAVEAVTTDAQTIAVLEGSYQSDQAMIEYLSTLKAADLSTATSQIAAGAAGVDAGIDQVIDTNQQLATSVAALDAGATQLNNSITYQDPDNDPTKAGLAQVVNILDESGAQLDAGTDQLAAGTQLLANSEDTQALVSGAQTLSSKTAELNSGVSQLTAALPQLASGGEQLVAGGQQLTEGTSALNEGAQLLSTNMAKFDSEGISPLVNTLTDDITTISDHMQAISDAAKSYTSFAGKNDNMAGSVKFIIETDALEAE